MIDSTLSFNELVQKMETITGKKTSKYRDKNVFYINIESNEGGNLLNKYHNDFAKAGAFLFYLGYKYNRIGIVEATNVWGAIKIVGVNGFNYDHSTDDVIQWLQEINEKEKIFITQIDEDLVGGYFINEISDKEWLAKKIYDFCPDFVDQGIGLDDDEDADPYQLIIDFYKKNKKFGFWWD